MSLGSRVNMQGAATGILDDWNNGIVGLKESYQFAYDDDCFSDPMFHHTTIPCDSEKMIGE